MANSILVVGKKTGSQNPLKNITSKMVASCFDITLLLTNQNITKVKKSCSRISSDTLYSSPLSIKVQIPTLITLITCSALLLLLLLVFVCLFVCFFFLIFICLCLFFPFLYFFLFPSPSISPTKINYKLGAIGCSLQVSIYF